MNKSKANPLKIAAPKPPVPIVVPDEISLPPNERKGLEDKKD